MSKSDKIVCNNFEPQARNGSRCANCGSRKIEHSNIIPPPVPTINSNDAPNLLTEPLNMSSRKSPLSSNPHRRRTTSKSINSPLAMQTTDPALERGSMPSITAGGITIDLTGFDAEFPMSPNPKEEERRRERVQKARRASEMNTKRKTKEGSSNSTSEDSHEEEPEQKEPKAKLKFSRGDGAGGPRKLERKSRLGKDDQAVSPKLSGSFPEFIISDELMSPRHTPDLDEVEMAQRARKADLIKQMEDSKKKIQENQLQRVSGVGYNRGAVPYKRKKKTDSLSESTDVLGRDDDLRDLDLSFGNASRNTSLGGEGSPTGERSASPTRTLPTSPREVLARVSRSLKDSRARPESPEQGDGEATLKKFLKLESEESNDSVRTTTTTTSKSRVVDRRARQRAREEEEKEEIERELRNKREQQELLLRRKREQQEEVERERLLRETEERNRQEQYFLELKKIEEREMEQIRFEREQAQKGREQELMCQLEKARELQEMIEREKVTREREMTEQRDREQREIKERELREEREREYREEQERLEREREEREQQEHMAHEERKANERREIERLLREEEERVRQEREERDRTEQAKLAESTFNKPPELALPKHAERIPNNLARDLASLTMSNPLPASERTEHVEKQPRSARRSSGWTIRPELISGGGGPDNLIDSDASLSSPRLVKARSIREKIGSAVPMKIEKSITKSGLSLPGVRGLRSSTKDADVLIALKSNPKSQRRKSSGVLDNDALSASIQQQGLAAASKRKNRHASDHVLLTFEGLPEPPKIMSMSVAMKLASKLIGKQTKAWNKEFQALRSEEEDTALSTYTALSSLLKDFHSVAEVYGKVIIAEKFLPNEQKTIKPIDNQDLVLHYTIEGILFSFMMDYLVGYDADETEIWRYGGDKGQEDEKAKKVANNCLKSISCIYNCQVPGICYPLLVVIEYRGLTLLAQSVIPIDTLVYGSVPRPDGTIEIVNLDPEVERKMKSIGTKLNLSEFVHQGKPVGPITASNVFVGTDRQYYVTDFENLIPPEDYYENICETLFNKMRSTYVAKSPRLKLCSDAFTITSLESSDRDIAIQSKKNLQENIPNISLLLSKELHDNKGNLSPEALVTIIHKQGMCCRHLGYLRSMTPSVELKKIILTEIIARGVKNEIRAVLRRSNRVYKTTSEEPYKEAVLVYLKPVLSYKIPAPTALVSEAEKTPLSSPDIHTKAGETLKLVANCVIPIPSRQSTFYMELKIESANPTFMFGICGSQPHNQMDDVTGYCISNRGYIIQGKEIKFTGDQDRIGAGDTIGVFYSWHSKQIIFTKNEKTTKIVGASRGIYIPKLVVGANSSVTINFGESGFNFDVESLCERLKLENPIIIDDSIQFWGTDVKKIITKRFRNCLTEQEQTSQVNLRSVVDLNQLVKRLEKLAGVKLSDRVHSYFKEDHNASFTLAGYDIVSLDSTMGVSELFEFSQGVVHLLDVMQRGSPLQDRESEILIESACEALALAYVHTPIINPTIYYHYGLAYHQKGIRLLEKDKAEGRRCFAIASRVWNEVLHAEGQFDDAQLGNILLMKGILEVENEKKSIEGLGKFYRIRETIGDDILIEQLDFFKSDLANVKQPAHIKRIANITGVIGDCFIDPCNAFACIQVASLLIDCMNFLYLYNELESWNNQYDKFVRRISRLIESVHESDAAILSQWLDDKFRGEIQHVVFTILLHISYSLSADYLRNLLVKLVLSRSIEDIVIAHPSLLLRRMILQVRDSFDAQSQKTLDHIASEVVELRSVNQWRYKMCPPECFVFGGTLTAVGDRIFLFGGNTGHEVQNRIFVYNISMDHWDLVEVSGAVPPPRQDHSANLIQENKILVFGGWNLEKKLNDCYIFETDTCVWREVKLRGDVPSPRCSFATCCCGDLVYFLGGKIDTKGAQGLQDLYALNLKNFSFELKKTWGKIPSSDYNFIACSIDNEVIFKFGGEFGGNQLHALHTGSLRWYTVNLGGRYPSFRSAQDSLNYICLNDKLVMFGPDSYALHLGVIPFDHPSYQAHFDPIGCVQNQENWVELDSTEFPQFERVFYASCLVGNKIYTHGGLKDDYALDSFYVYDIGINKWSEVIPNGEKPEDLYGHTLCHYNNKLYLFGGCAFFQDQIDAFNELWEYDIEQNSWKLITVTHASAETEGHVLSPRSFHVAAVYRHFLVVCGGEEDLAEDDVSVEVINLETFQMMPIFLSGELPRPRSHSACLLKGHLLHIFGGSINEVENYDFSSCLVLNLETFAWSYQAFQGNPPQACFGPSLILDGHYVLKYGGVDSSMRLCDKLSILNLDTNCWEAEMDSEIVPLECHQCFKYEQMMYIVESGFEVAYFKIDSGDRLGVFNQIKTFGASNAGRGAAVCVSQGTAYVLGGSHYHTSEQQKHAVKGFSAIDIEVNCFVGEESHFSSLPKFSSLNKHLKITIIEIEEMGGRNDDLDCDAYLTSTYNGQRESSNTQKSTLNPIFNESFYFSDVKENPFIIIEVRDFKDGFFYGCLRLNTISLLSLSSKNPYERTVDLTDLNGNRLMMSNGCMAGQIHYSAISY